LWKLGYRGENVRVGVVGTGVDLRHPDFQRNHIEALSQLGDDGNDNIAHETGVVWLVTRAAPQAAVISVKVQDQDNVSMAYVIDACERLRQLGVQVLNLSLSTEYSTDGTDPLSREVNYLTEHGITVVAAAGNNGPGLQTIGSPGAAEQAITVGKVNDRDVVMPKSSRGPTVDGRMKPDCVAPGDRIPAAIPLRFSRGLYWTFECTSYATPHVTGIVALLKQAFPDADPPRLKQAILGTCDPAYLPAAATADSLITRLRGKFKSGLSQLPDPHWFRGSGRVNGYHAYEWLKNAKETQPPN